MRAAVKVAGASAGALLLVGLGAGIGSAGQHEKVVEKTPVSCIEVIEMFEESTTIGSKQMNLWVDTTRAVQARDSDRLGEITSKINGLTDQLNDLADRVGGPVADCRSK